VVVHSYRHRDGLAAGDPAFQQLADKISTQPSIGVPTVVIDPQDDPLVGSAPPRSERERRFPALLDVVSVAAGHNVPQENPEAFAAAVLHAHRHS